jgi:ABC-type Fe3+/spermidine/putrescine transport system ATPase subunit
VALARALVLEPAILLLDEPLGAIDLKLRKTMQVELRELNRALGITFVYVTHDQDEALTMSDRIAVMDRGRIAQLGSPAEIYENPRTAFVATFIGESNLLQGTVQGQRGAMWEVKTSLGLTVDVPDQPGLSSGRAITLAIRPEWADLFAPDAVPAGENALPGTVADVVYQGEMMRVRVAIGDGSSLVVAVRNEGQLTRPLEWKRGDQVAVGWRPEDSQLLEEA